MNNRNKLFISYSHQDIKWLNAITEQFAVLESEGLVSLCEDSQLKVGENWVQQLNDMMLDARLGLLLISAPFLISKFVREQEIPRLFARHGEGGMKIYPLLVRPCPWEQVEWLAQLQLRPQDPKAAPQSALRLQGRRERTDPGRRRLRDRSHGQAVMDAQGQSLLDALLDSWSRNNTVLLNLLGAVPPGGLQARAMAGSPTVSEMFTHLHHERMISVLENAPECAGEVPAQEWNPESDPSRIARMLQESAQRVLDAVQGRVEAGRPLDREFAHPIHLLQFLIFHEGYHHGQIKLALKAAGCPISDQDAGPLTWSVWRDR